MTRPIAKNAAHKATQNAATKKPPTRPLDKRKQPAASTGSHHPSRWKVTATYVRRWLRGAFLDNIALKAVALVLSITLFIVVNTDRDAVIGVSVGVSYTYPSDRVLVSQPVNQVHVTIRGSWRRIKRFDERELDRINVDLRGVRASEYTFSEDQIRLPSGIQLLAIDPPSIPLSFQPIAEKTVRVVVETSGTPAPGYHVSRIAARPSQITVRGAKSEIDELESISTRDLDLSGRSQSFSLSLPLNPLKPAPIIELLDANSVEVEVEITEEMSSRTISSVPVDIHAARGVDMVNPAQRFHVTPGTVDVTLFGPKLTVSSFQGALEAHVDVTASDLHQPPRQVKVVVDNAPDGVGIKVVPQSVTLSPLSRNVPHDPPASASP